MKKIFIACFLIFASIVMHAQINITASTTAELVRFALTVDGVLQDGRNNTIDTRTNWQTSKVISFADDQAIRDYAENFGISFAVDRRICFRIQGKKRNCRGANCVGEWSYPVRCFDFSADSGQDCCNYNITSTDGSIDVSGPTDVDGVLSFNLSGTQNHTHTSSDGSILIDSSDPDNIDFTLPSTSSVCCPSVDLPDNIDFTDVVAVSSYINNYMFSNQNCQDDLLFIGGGDITELCNYKMTFKPTDVLLNVTSSACPVNMQGSNPAFMPTLEACFNSAGVNYSNMATSLGSNGSLTITYISDIVVRFTVQSASSIGTVLPGTGSCTNVVGDRYVYQANCGEAAILLDSPFDQVVTDINYAGDVYYYTNEDGQNVRFGYEFIDSESVNFDVTPDGNGVHNVTANIDFCGAGLKDNGVVFGDANGCMEQDSIVTHTPEGIVHVTGDETQWLNRDIVVSDINSAFSNYRETELTGVDILMSRHNSNPGGSNVIEMFAAEGTPTAPTNMVATATGRAVGSINFARQFAGVKNIVGQYQVNSYGNASACDETYHELSSQCVVSPYSNSTRVARFSSENGDWWAPHYGLDRIDTYYDGRFLGPGEDGKIGAFDASLLTQDLELIVDCTAGVPMVGLSNGSPVKAMPTPSLQVDGGDMVLTQCETELSRVTLPESGTLTQNAQGNYEIEINGTAACFEACCAEEPHAQTIIEYCAGDDDMPSNGFLFTALGGDGYVITHPASGTTSLTILPDGVSQPLQNTTPLPYGLNLLTVTAVNGCVDVFPILVRSNCPPLIEGDIGGTYTYNPVTQQYTFDAILPCPEFRQSEVIVACPGDPIIFPVTGLLGGYTLTQPNGNATVGVPNMQPGIEYCQYGTGEGDLDTGGDGGAFQLAEGLLGLTGASAGMDFGKWTIEYFPNINGCAEVEARCPQVWDFYVVESTACSEELTCCPPVDMTTPLSGGQVVINPESIAEIQAFQDAYFSENPTCSRSTKFVHGNKCCAVSATYSSSGIQVRNTGGNPAERTIRVSSNGPTTSGVLPASVIVNGVPLNIAPDGSGRFESDPFLLVNGANTVNVQITDAFNGLTSSTSSYVYYDGAGNTTTISPDTRIGQFVNCDVFTDFLPGTYIGSVVGAGLIQRTIVEAHLTLGGVTYQSTGSGVNSIVSGETATNEFIYTVVDDLGNASTQSGFVDVVGVTGCVMESYSYTNECGVPFLIEAPAPSLDITTNSNNTLTIEGTCVPTCDYVDSLLCVSNIATVGMNHCDVNDLNIEGRFNGVLVDSIIYTPALQSPVPTCTASDYNAAIAAAINNLGSWQLFCNDIRVRFTSFQANSLFLEGTGINNYTFPGSFTYYWTDPVSGCVVAETIATSCAVASENVADCSLNAETLSCGETTIVTFRMDDLTDNLSLLFTAPNNSEFITPCGATVNWGSALTGNLNDAWNNLGTWQTHPSCAELSVKIENGGGVGTSVYYNIYITYPGADSYNYSYGFEVNYNCQNGISREEIAVVNCKSSSSTAEQCTSSTGAIGYYVTTPNGSCACVFVDDALSLNTEATTCP